VRFGAPWGFMIRAFGYGEVCRSRLLNPQLDAQFLRLPASTCAKLLTTLFTLLGVPWANSIGYSWRRVGYWIYRGGFQGGTPTAGKGGWGHSCGYGCEPSSLSPTATASQRSEILYFTLLDQL
jgi:hypothetical protein